MHHTQNSTHRQLPEAHATPHLNSRARLVALPSWMQRCPWLLPLTHLPATSSRPPSPAVCSTCGLTPSPLGLDKLPCPTPLPQNSQSPRAGLGPVLFAPSTLEGDFLFLCFLNPPHSVDPLRVGTVFCSFIYPQPPKECLAYIQWVLN